MSLLISIHVGVIYIIVKNALYYPANAEHKIIGVFGYTFFSIIIQITHRRHKR